MENGNWECQKPLWCQWGVRFVIAVAFVLMDWVKRWKSRSSLAVINCIFLFVLILTQGVKQTDHFGLICRDQSESGHSQYMCYVFQCASESLVSQTKEINENDYNFYSLHNILIPTNYTVLFFPLCLFCFLISLYVSGRWGDADPEAGLHYSSSLTEQQDRDPAMWSLPHAWPAQALRAYWRWAMWTLSHIQHFSLIYWFVVCFSKFKNLFLLHFLFLGLYPPRAKLAIQKYLSQLTDNEQAEIFERVQVRFSLNNLWHITHIFLVLAWNSLYLQMLYLLQSSACFHFGL